MAEKQRDRKQLARKLDQDLDTHLESVLEKNKDYKYSDGLTADNLEEQLRQIPAFSNEVPTQEDIDASPALQALQAIKYETDDPHECALSHKEDGNYHFQKKDYKLAITAYTEGLKQTHDDATLSAVLYTNRAAANFHLGNNRSALNDAKLALKHKPDHMKALIRGAICSFDLERYDECIKWCQDGLMIDSKEKRLLDMKKKSNHQKKQQGRDKRKQEMKRVKDLTKRNSLLETIESRNINIELVGGEKSIRNNLEQLLMDNNAPHSGKIYVDENKKLHWPVYFLYPEFNQSDFIEDFDEDTRFIDQLSLAFDSSPEWDKQKAYTMAHIQVYFEDRHRNKLIHVSLNTTLKMVLSDKRFTLHGGCPALIVLSKKTSYYNETFENQSSEEFL